MAIPNIINTSGVQQVRNPLLDPVIKSVDAPNFKERKLKQIMGPDGKWMFIPESQSLIDNPFSEVVSLDNNVGLTQRTPTVTVNGVGVDLSVQSDPNNNGAKTVNETNNSTGADNGYGTFADYTPGSGNDSVLGNMDAFGRNMSQSAVNLGKAIGQMKSWKDSGEEVSRTDRARNRMMGVGAGLSLVGGAVSAGFDLFKQGAAASAAAQREGWIDRENRRKLANARQGQVTAVANGGLITGNDGSPVPVTGPSGEFIAPKRGGGNIVAEEGEVASIPEDNLTKEFLGERHEDGGTPTSVPDGTRILSDRRKLTDAQAREIRDRFGIKVSAKDTYSDVAKKYKKKIGLDEALDEMASLEEKLKKNVKNIKDESTARLNSSIISDHMEEVQKKIDALSEDDSAFFDVLFNLQESEKREQLRQFYFADGGAVNREMFDESRKKYGLTEEEAIEYFLDRAMKFDDGGQYLEFVPIYNSRRTDTETYGNNGYQALINGTYGKVSEWGESAIAEMARLHPELTRGANKVINIGADGKASWVNPSNAVGNARAIENVVNRTYSGLRALSDMIPNYKKDARDFLMYDFSNKTEQGPDPKSGTTYAHNERTGEGRLGEYHMTRSAAGLRVVTPEQLKALNERGIRNFSDVLANPDKAKEVLNDTEYQRLVSLNGVKRKEGDKEESSEGLDFVLMSYNPLIADPIKDPGPDVLGVQPAAKPIAEKLDPLKDPNPVSVKPQGTPKDKTKPTKVGRTAEGLPGLFGAIGWDSAGMQPSPRDPNYLNQVRYMRAEPVLRTADEVVSGINAGTNAQIRSLNDVADPQRYAALANIGAKRDEAIDRAISEIDYANAVQRNRASELNEGRYMQTDQINAGLRDQYEQRVLQDKAANEDAWFKYFQNIRDRQLAEDEVRIKAQVLSNIYPNVDIYGRNRNWQDFQPSQMQKIENIRNQYADSDKKKKTSKTSSKKGG